MQCLLEFYGEYWMIKVRYSRINNNYLFSDDVMMKSVARSGESTGIELAGVVLTLWTRERVECVREELDRFGAERTPEGESCILSRWGTLPPLMWPSFSTESKVAKLEVRSVCERGGVAEEGGPNNLLRRYTLRVYYNTTSYSDKSTF